MVIAHQNHFFFVTLAHYYYPEGTDEIQMIVRTRPIQVSCK